MVPYISIVFNRKGNEYGHQIPIHTDKQRKLNNWMLAIAPELIILRRLVVTPQLIIPTKLDTLPEFIILPELQLLPGKIFQHLLAPKIL
jgi:hypothetical protein